MWIEAHTNLFDLNVQIETEWNWLCQSINQFTVQLCLPAKRNPNQLNEWSLIEQFWNIWLPNPIKINQIIGVWLRSITEHLIDSTWYKPIFGCIAQPNVVRNFPPKGNEGSGHKKNNKQCKKPFFSGYIW